MDELASSHQFDRILCTFSLDRPWSAEAAFPKLGGGPWLPLCCTAFYCNHPSLAWCPHETVGLRAVKGLLTATSPASGSGTDMELGVNECLLQSECDLG